ncbi:MAG: AAA family ATPase [Bacteroidetes bacterium]|nr:AAA family ATPase [Bacteroidota bacterium]
MITQKLHDRIFTYLTSKKWKDTEFTFRLRRSNRYNRLSEGFWFHGTENYLALSFWDGSDWKNKTPNISFFFTAEDHAVYILLSAKDSKEKTDFFEKYFVGKDKSYKSSQPDNPKATFEDKNYYKELKYKWSEQNIESVLDKLIRIEKKTIDVLLRKWLKYYVPSDETNRFGFIDKTDFEKLYKKIEKHRAEFIRLLQTSSSKKSADEYVLSGTTESRHIEILQQAKQNLNEIPIRINSIEIKEYKNLKDISKINIPKNKQWIFVTGENGSGKTSFLEAIALSMKGNYDEDRIINKSGALIRTEFFDNGVIKRNKIDKHKLSKSFQEIKEFICYSSNRFENENFNLNSNDKNKTLSLFEPESTPRILSLESALIDWSLKARIDSLERKTGEKKLSTMHIAANQEGFYDELIKNIKEIFLGSEEEKLNQGLLPELVDFKVIHKTLEDKVLYVLGDKNRTELEFKKLSTGNKSILTMVGDLIIRFIQYHSTDEFPDPANFTGIVLIDELDAHIHPKWQWQITNILSEMFPNIQFIATCHSPIPLLGIKDPSRTLFLRAFKDEYFTSKIEPFEVEIKRLTPNSVLTSPLFGFRDILPASFDVNVGFTSKVDYEEEVFNKVLKRKINEIKFNEKN